MTSPAYSDLSASRTLGWLVLGIGGAALLAGLATLVTVPRVAFIAALCGIVALLIVAIAAPIAASLRTGERWMVLPFGLAAGFFVYVAIRMGTSSFAVDDEIYSWNMWAVQHFRGETVDITYTEASYPQLFPWLVSACYRAMDTVRIQAVPRLFAAISTLIFFLSILNGGQGRPWLGAIVISTVFFGLGFRRELSVGLADPLMAAALLASVMFAIRYDRDPECEGTLAFAVAAAVIACLTKQAALIWGCATLPILIAIGVAQGRYRRRALVITVTGTALCLLWPLVLAPHFANNPGVIHASMGQRTYGQQLLFAADRYLVHQPVLLVLLMASIVAVRRGGFLIGVWMIGLLPMALAWFLFGAYQTRLGIHVVGLAALLVMAGFAIPPQPSYPPLDRHRARGWSFAAAALVLATIAGGTLIEARRKGIDLRDGPRMTFIAQYGAQAGSVFDQLIRENARIWATSNYAYGPFYGVLPVGRPNHSVIYDQDRVKRDLLAFAADYAIYAGSVPFSSQSPVLKSLAEACPQALLPVLAPPNQHGFILYRVERTALSQTCRS